MIEPTISENPHNALSDEALMQHYARGDMDAFDTLYHRHKDSVYAFIHQFVTTPDRIDDLFQTVFMRIIRSRERYQPTARFTTWLYTITRSVCIDAMRKMSRADVIPLFPGQNGETTENEIDTLSGKEPSAREAACHAEIEREIENAIRSLPENQREVLMLRERTDLTFEEIGRVTGCSINTAKSRMHYALLALRRELQKRGIEPL